jgi:hypothetical protein
LDGPSTHHRTALGSKARNLLPSASFAGDSWHQTSGMLRSACALVGIMAVVYINNQARLNRLPASGRLTAQLPRRTIQMLVYEKYVGEAAAEIPTSYRAAQDRAQAERAGLWQDPDPVPSWEWRKSQKVRSRRAQDAFGLTKPPVLPAPFKGHLYLK